MMIFDISRWILLLFLCRLGRIFRIIICEAQEVESRHTRRASEKTKKRMKMADLKAFVETKLLSKSEKALEKIGQEEPKMLFEQVNDCCSVLSVFIVLIIHLSISRNVTQVLILETII